MSAIKKFLELNKINRLTIAVVGDVMVDEYYNVTADRVSPEFPIPVMLSPDGKPSLSLPGGAANVVQQFKHFNVGTTLWGFNDKTTEKVIPWIRSGHGFGLKEPEQWVRNKVKQVPIKKRYYQGDFPLCRLDIEQKNYGEKEENLNFIRQALFQEFWIVNPPIVILSDYNKGFFNTNSKLWLQGRISIVDPKKGPISKWQSCTVIKPNAKEAEELSGETDWHKQADYFERETNCKAVIITQSGDGVVGKIEGEYFEHRPVKKTKATSVIGAGDCFMAFLAMALGHKFSYLDAVKLAFEAGCIYVQNKHNQALSPTNFHVKSDQSFWSNKVVVADELKGDGLVFTNGVFDILHPSHLDLLRFAKSQGKQLVVAVNSDASVKRLKGDFRPINTMADRIAMLAAYDFVDYVTWFEEDTPAEVIQKIMPNKIVKGGDYRPETVVGHEIVGIENVVIFPYQDGYSTTNIVNKIKS